jgi:hypothetical protein
VAALFVLAAVAVGRGVAHSVAGAFGVLLTLLGIGLILQGRFEVRGEPDLAVTGSLREF